MAKELVDLADLAKERVAVVVPDLFRGTASPSDSILYEMRQAFQFFCPFFLSLFMDFMIFQVGV